jgi:hypothetical protein
MSDQAITTVEELPAELRAELVAKREAGTTLAELKKQNPHVAPDVIRAVLLPPPKPDPEPKPAPKRAGEIPAKATPARTRQQGPRPRRRRPSRPAMAARPTRSGWRWRARSSPCARSKG